jgi:hypothetical protein
LKDLLVSLKVKGGAQALKVFLLGCQMKEENALQRVNISNQSESLQDNVFWPKNHLHVRQKRSDFLVH